MNYKHCVHMNNAISSSINHGRTASLPKNLQQSQLVPHINNYHSNQSPKQIDNSNATSKFIQHKNNKSQNPLKLCYQMNGHRGEHPTKSFESTPRHYSTIDLISKPENYAQSEIHQEGNTKTKSIYPNKDNTNLKERVDYLEEELLSMKGNSKGNSSIDKLALLIDLVRKYCKKLFALVNIDNKSNLETSQISNELVFTIEQFSKMVFNKKVDTLISNAISLCRKQKRNDTRNITCSDGVELFISKYEQNIEKIQKERDDLEQLLLQRENQLNQALDANSKEIASLRQKLREEMLHNDDIEKLMLSLKTANKDIETKCLLLEEERSAYKEKVNTYNNKEFEGDVAMNKLINYQKELSYKDSIISYLESLLIKIPVQSNLIGKDAYAENYNNLTNSGKNNKNNNQNYKKIESINKESNGFTNSKESISSYNEAKEKKNKHNGKNKKEEVKQYDSPKIPPKSSERPSIIKKEIEEIDKEIFELQSQLRFMLDKK